MTTKNSTRENPSKFWAIRSDGLFDIEDIRKDDLDYISVFTDDITNELMGVVVFKRQIRPSSTGITLLNDKLFVDIEIQRDDVIGKATSFTSVRDYDMSEGLSPLWIHGSLPMSKSFRNGTSGDKNAVDWAEEAKNSACVRDFLGEALREKRMSPAMFESAEKFAQLFGEIDAKRSKKIVAQGETLQPWQSELTKIIERPPNGRDVYWIYDSIGNSGKSWYTRWAQKIWPDEIYATQATKGQEMLYQLAKYQRVKAMILDVPRHKSTTYLSYDTIESVKTGEINSTKYMPIRKSFGDLHVICFSNSMPQLGALSEDRWKIYNLVPQGSVKQLVKMTLAEARQVVIEQGCLQGYNNTSV